MMVSADDLLPISPSAAAIASGRLRARFPVTLRLAGETCVVRFDDAETCRLFARRYADMAADGNEPAAHEAFAVRDPVLGHLFWATGDTAYRWPHGAAAPHVVAFLADAVALTAFIVRRTDGLISLHAAVAAIEGGAAAIIGDSNAGKTTTALACARIGMQLYSDERCIIGRETIAHPFPRAMNIRDTGRRLLTQDVLDDDDPVGRRLRARPEGAWDDVLFSDLFGRNEHRPQPLRAAFLIAGVASQPSLEPATASQATRAANRWAYGAGRGLDKLARLFEIFRNVACFSLVLGTPDASARAIRGELEATCLERC
jgi:hypothetical protein